MDPDYFNSTKSDPFYLIIGFSLACLFLVGMWIK
jgi:hypothetical protein